MLGIINKSFLLLLTGIVNASNHTKYVSLNNQNCKIQANLINLHLNEYSQELHYYQFPTKLDKWVGRCNTLNHLYNKFFVPNKTEDLNIHVFNIITEKIESKILLKETSCECKCKFDGKECNWSQWWNNNKCRC